MIITLNEQNQADLKAYINKIPTMYGVELLAFFGKLEDEQTPKPTEPELIKAED